MDIPVVGAPRSANSRQQGRLHTHCQEEGARNVPELRLWESNIPLRRTTKEVLARTMPAADAKSLT